MVREKGPKSFGGFEKPTPAPYQRYVYGDQILVKKRTRIIWQMDRSAVDVF